MPFDPSKKGSPYNVMPYTVVLPEMFASRWPRSQSPQKSPRTKSPLAESPRPKISPRNKAQTPQVSQRTLPALPTQSQTPKIAPRTLPVQPTAAAQQPKFEILVKETKSIPPQLDIEKVELETKIKLLQMIVDVRAARDEAKKQVNTKKPQQTAHIFRFLQKAESAEIKKDIKAFHTFCSKAEDYYLLLDKPVSHDDLVSRNKLHRIISRNIRLKEFHPLTEEIINKPQVRLRARTGHHMFPSFHPLAEKTTKKAGRKTRIRSNSSP